MTDVDVLSLGGCAGKKCMGNVYMVCIVGLRTIIAQAISSGVYMQQIYIRVGCLGQLLLRRRLLLHRFRRVLQKVVQTQGQRRSWKMGEVVGHS